MRSSLVVAIAVSTGVLSTSGCYMDGAWRAPTWNNMTAWWQKPKAESTSMAAAGPSVHLPSQNASPTTTTTPGAASAMTASTQGASVSPAYDATKASYTNVSPNMYPSTGMAAFNTPGAANRANTAAYDASSRGAGAYSTAGPYDSRPAHDYAQTGPYDTVYGVANRAAANNANNPTPGVTQNPYANNPAQPATPAITDRSIAAGAQQDRYRDTAPIHTNPPAANSYIPAQNDPRVAARDTTAANPATNPAAANPVIGPGTVRTRSENPYEPGATGYNPGNTGYQPPPGSGYDPAMNGAAVPGQSQGAAAIPSQNQTAAAQPAPRRESSWSPGGTSRYPGANPAAATTATNTLPHSQPVHQPAAAPTSHYNDPRDPNTPDAPARVHDPSRYDDMR